MNGHQWSLGVPQGQDTQTAGPKYVEGNGRRAVPLNTKRVDTWSATMPFNANFKRKSRRNILTKEANGTFCLMGH